MLIGLPPFYVQDRREIYKRIIQNRARYPKNLNPFAVDLIEKLLSKDPIKRLGQRGGEEIMEHPWFNDINWELLEAKKIMPPYIPRINDPLDPSYFSDDFTLCAIEESPHASPSPSCSLTFKGFSYNESSGSQALEIDL